MMSVIGLFREDIRLTIVKDCLPPACGYLWSVVHESLTIFAGSRHSGLSFVAIISQASSQAGRIRFVGRNGTLRKVRRSLAEK
jgi:hypothetical protein